MHCHGVWHYSLDTEVSHNFQVSGYLRVGFCSEELSFLPGLQFHLGEVLLVPAHLLRVPLHTHSTLTTVLELNSNIFQPLLTKESPCLPDFSFRSTIWRVRRSEKLATQRKIGSNPKDVGLQQKSGTSGFLSNLQLLEPLLKSKTRIFIYPAVACACHFSCK